MKHVKVVTNSPLANNNDWKWHFLNACFILSLLFWCNLVTCGYHNNRNNISHVFIREGKVSAPSPGRSGGRILFSRVNCLCWLLFRYPFHPRVTAVARKRSWSFYQKCRWQVTPKHTYTLPMWLWMKWHRNLVHGWIVYTELAPKRQHSTWHQPCNNHRALPVHHFRGY